MLLLSTGQLGSASSLTNLSSEPDYPPQRTRSASELLEHSSILSPARLRSRQRSRDLRLSLANSRSDYYNNCRPQSISLSSQIPAHSNLQSASSVLALGTISETDAAFRRSTNGPISTDSIFAEPPDTPLFHYHPTLSLTELATPTRGGSFRNSRLSHTSSNQGPITAGAGHHQLNGTNSICYAYSPTPSAVAPMIHVSEPIAREFVALYLNPLTGQMYSHTQDYFRPISSPKELLAKPPIPVCKSNSPIPCRDYVEHTCLLHRINDWRRNRHYHHPTSHSHRSWPYSSLCVEIS